MRWIQVTWLAAGLLCAAAGTGCNGGPSSGARPGTTGAADSTGGRSSWVQKRPQAKVDSIRVEGTTQRVDLTLFDRGLPFSTYVPAQEIDAEVLSTRDGRTARFTAAFAGKKNPDVYFDIFIPASPTTLADIRHRLLDQNGIIAQLGLKMESGRYPTTDICPWADESYFFVHPTASGSASVTICVGRHKDNAFYMILQVPGDYAEGFTSRIDLILRELRWMDDGTKLGQG